MAKFTNARERPLRVGGVFAPRVKPHIVSILRANAWSYLFAIRSGASYLSVMMIEVSRRADRKFMSMSI